MSTPEGWYDDGSGRTRWWDGAAWTEYYADTYDEQVAAVPTTSIGSPSPVSPLERARTGIGSVSPGPLIPVKRSPFPAWGWGGVVLIVVGGIVFLVGRDIYYSDPYYNNTTDPVGIATMLVGAAIGLVGIIVTRIAFGSRG